MIGIWGANGFIGRHLAYALASSGQDFALFARDFSGFPFSLPDGTALVTGDFTKPEQTIEKIRKCTVLILAVSAARTRGPIMASDLAAYEAFFDTLASGAAPAHIIYLSSGGAVYGPIADKPATETHPTHPLSFYGRDKLTIEQLIEARASNVPWRYSILRIANPVGLWSKNLFLPALALKAAHTGRPLTIFGDGCAIRDYFDVEELAQAIMLCAAKPGANEIYNIGSGAGRSIHEVIAIAEWITGKNIPINYQEANPLDLSYNVLDCKKIEKALGWRVRKKLDDSMQAMWDAA